MCRVNSNVLDDEYMLDEGMLITFIHPHTYMSKIEEVGEVVWWWRPRKGCLKLKKSDCCTTFSHKELRVFVSSLLLIRMRININCMNPSLMFSTTTTIEYRVAGG